MISLASSAAHVVVADPDAPELSDADRHHLARVLRLRSGERVTVTDGRGAWRWCAWTGTGLIADGPGGVAPRLVPSVGVAFCLVKGDRVDWMVQKLTELGVDRLIPMVSERTVVRPDPARADAQHARMVRIAHEAAMQSSRVWLPVVEPVRAAVEVLGRDGVARADYLGGAWTAAASSVTTLAVGPEGGWSATERELPGPTVSLSDLVLRTETAAVTAAVLLAERRRARVQD